jgi:hypothetical protein
MGDVAAQIVRRNPLAQGNSHFAPARARETILASRPAGCGKKGSCTLGRMRPFRLTYLRAGLSGRGLQTSAGR